MLVHESMCIVPFYCVGNKQYTVCTDSYKLGLWDIKWDTFNCLHPDHPLNIPTKAMRFKRSRLLNLWQFQKYEQKYSTSFVLLLGTEVSLTTKTNN